MSVLLAPHDDDEGLFASGIIMRYKPHVVVCTCSLIQFNRGQTEITAERRHKESASAMKLLGASVEFLNLPDNDLRYDNLIWALKPHPETTLCFAPAKQGGNAQHDLVSDAASNMFKRVIFYATYAKDQWFTPLEQGIRLVLTPEERELKLKVLDCYESQQFQNHFAEVRKVMDEWISEEP